MKRGARFADVGTTPADSAHLRLSKQNAARFALLIAPATMLGAVMLAAVGEWVAFACGTVSSTLFLLNVVGFAASKNLRSFLTRATIISVVSTIALRFTMRSLPGSEVVLLSGLTWVTGAALTGRRERVVRVGLVFLAVMVLTEAFVHAFPAPVRAYPAGYPTLVFLYNAVTLATWLTLMILPLAQGRRELANALEEEHRRSERLLLNVLPASIAVQLKKSPAVIADRFESATVLFADIVGFTTMSARMTPEALVKLLAEIFSAFDALSERHGVEKIKTIGDAYMVAGGLPAPRADHACAVARLALDLQKALERWPELKLRIGLHSGAVVAGVIGSRKFSYDLWGDTVNTASRMESHGLPGAIQLSEATRTLLGDQFILEPRGEIDVKGKGRMSVWLLTGERESAPTPGFPGTSPER